MPDIRCIACKRDAKDAGPAHEEPGSAAAYVCGADESWRSCLSRLELPCLHDEPASSRSDFTGGSRVEPLPPSRLKPLPPRPENADQPWAKEDAPACSYCSGSETGTLAPWSGRYRDIADRASRLATEKRSTC